MSLATLAAKFDSFAAEVITDAKDAGLETAAEVVEAVGEGLDSLVDKVGASATKFVTDLMADDSLSGLEKANLAATQLVQEAATRGITIVDHDVTYLIKNAYEAVAARLRSLKS